MTADQYRQELMALLNRTPRPGAIDTIAKARAFKAAYASAKKAAYAAKSSVERLQNAYGELQMFHQPQGENRV